MTERANARGLLPRLMAAIWRLMAFCMLAHGVAAAAPLPCEARQGREAISFGGEISGKHIFSMPVGPGWFFEMTPADHGWTIRLLDGNRLDLAQMTPPLRGPNSRDVVGWHFRNAANSGPNTGDVNAPQELRLFGFDPRLSGTAGVKPAADFAGVADQPGRGALMIEDYGLSDLSPGQTSRMTYLKFSVCLNWPSEYGPARPETMLAEPTPELIEIMGACGLSDAYEITPDLLPIALQGDFTGKDYLDTAVPVRRVSDNKRGIAVCRAGTRLDLLGFAGKIGAELEPIYFDHSDWWAHTARQELERKNGPPIRIPDGITLGIEGASSVLIYWDGEVWTSEWMGD